MRTFLIFFSLVVTFFLEQILNFSGSHVSLNILTVLAVFYFTGKNFWENLAVACFVGVLYDLTSVNFFGAYILIFTLSCLFVRIIVNKFFPANLSFINAQLTVILGLIMTMFLKITLFSSSLFGNTSFKIIISSFYWLDVLIQIIVSLFIVFITYPFWRFITSIKDIDRLRNHGNI
jgi:rod shape-determining protein MreD